MLQIYKKKDSREAALTTKTLFKKRIAFLQR
jgi:hypothetical protein